MSGHAEALLCPERPCRTPAVPEAVPPRIACFACHAGTSRTPPVNPLLTYAVDVLGLTLRPKSRDGAAATLVYDRCARWMCGAGEIRTHLAASWEVVAAFVPVWFLRHPSCPCLLTCSEGQPIPQSLHLAAEEKYAELLETLLER